MLSATCAQVSQRTVELGSVLDRLSFRPDIRQSQPFRTFIDFDSQTNFSVAPHELERGRTNVDQRFGLVGLAFYGDAIVGVHTDTTSLSRLGRVWSIVESDELAQLTIWRKSRGLEASDANGLLPLGEKLFSKLLPEKANCVRMSSKGELFLGMGDGTIMGYKLEDPSKPFTKVIAHGKSPVIAFELLNDETLVSVGLDAGLRISSSRSGQLIGGGKLTKRLEVNEVFRCLALHRDSGRAFIGTDKGRVFIFDISTGSPQYLHSLMMSSFPVRTVHTSDSHLLVGFASFINVYPIGSKGNERSMSREFQIQTSNSAKVHSCCTIPNTPVTIAGLSDGSVTVYSKANIIYSRFFSEERINVIHFSDREQVLWAGGDDGRIVEVKIPTTLIEDVKYVDQFGCSEENEKPIAIPNIPSAAKSVALKKSPALAEDESDDEWRKGLFSN